MDGRYAFPTYIRHILMKASNPFANIIEPGVPFYRNKKLRAVIYQIVLLTIVVFAAWTIFNNTLINMNNRGIQTGFGFLGVEAGFPILYSPFMEYNPSIDSYSKTFLIGLLNTILISILGIILATILGFVIALGRLSNNWLISQIANVYIEIFRNTPLLLQMMFWYFAILIPFLPEVQESISFWGESVVLNKKGLFLPKPIPQDGFGLVLIACAIAIIGSYVYSKYAKSIKNNTSKNLPVFVPVLATLIGLPLLVYFLSGSPLEYEIATRSRFRYSGGINLIPELAAVLFALTIYTAAFIAENIRGGVLAVSHGQTEASYALGLTPWQTLRLIIIPQALRVIVPPQTSQYLNLTKNSSLATAVGYPDLVSVFAGTVLNQTGKAVEIIAMTMLVYLTLSLLTSFFMNWYNKKIALIER